MQSIQSINELKLEIIRQKFYPNKVSRFRGFYYFENPETAKIAADSWNIEYMNPFCLAEVGIAPNSIYSKMDSNWITFYLSKENKQDDWIHNYWKGEVCPEFDKPIWELLVVARGVIYGTELRERAYEQIRNNNPTTILPMLEQARIAAWLGSDLGHVAPYITSLGKNRFKVVDIMDMRDAKNPEYLDKLRKYIENAANKNSINHADLKLIDRYNVFSVPDTRKRNFEFSIPDRINIDFNIHKLSHT